MGLAMMEWLGVKINKTERHLMTVREIGHKLTKSNALLSEYVFNFFSSMEE